MSTEKELNSLWDYAAYASIPADGKRHEIIAGEHFANPAPNLYHQEISRHMQFQLYTQIEQRELGVVINAPVDLQLTTHDIVQPDIVVVTKPKRHILTPSRIKGIPDLVIEILSPSNPNHDLKDKRALYERSGVPEYWMVSPEEHEVVQLILMGDKYVEKTETETITMAGSPFATVNLKKVW